MNDALIVGLACIGLGRPADKTGHRWVRQAFAEVLAEVLADGGLVHGLVHEQSGTQQIDILEKCQ
ncbi:MAG: hypothetical protein EBY28_11715 [Betaproteobacteria bacterium]|nr:hypothetical protein [Betaproteobacteria bacterium]